MAIGLGVRRAWQRVANAVSWTPPAPSEISGVAKAGLAAGLAWWLTTLLTDEVSPVLASLTAVVVVQVSVGSPIRTALERSAAVVLGVLLALAIGDALDLNAIVVAVLVAASLAIAELLLRLPRAAARQVPVSVLAVLSTISVGAESSSGRTRMLNTLIGAVVGVAVSLVLPVSRAKQAWHALEQLGEGLHASLNTMAAGLQEPWSTHQSEEWRRNARTVRERLVRDASEAIDNGGSIRWNIRDRRHIELFQRLQNVMPRLERTAIGVSVISRGLDDHARLTGTTHAAMPSMGRLLAALADAVRAVTLGAMGESAHDHVAPALDAVRVQRARCVQAASRRAHAAAEHSDSAQLEQLEGEWLNYAALLVQVDRIVVDLNAPLPT